MLRRRSATAVALLGSLAIALRSLHAFIQQHHAGVAHPYLDGSYTSTFKHIKSAGPSWMAASMGGGSANDGWIDTAWNDRWENNFAGPDDLIDSAGGDSGFSAWWAGYDSPGPVRGVVTMTRDEALETANSIRKVIPILQEVFPAADSRRTRLVTISTLGDLANCLEQDSCAPGQTTVFLAASYHFLQAEEGGTQGEDIWAKSITEAVASLGHTQLYAEYGLEAWTIYRAIPHMVTTVVLEASQLDRCTEFGVPHLIKAEHFKENEGATQISFAEAMRIRAELGLSVQEKEKDGEIWGWRGALGSSKLQKDGHVGCAKRRGFEEGIPVWKMFPLHFWDTPAHPLGHAWTLAPEDFATHLNKRGSEPDNFYLGYTIEPYCTQVPTVSPQDRLNRAFIYAKQLWYFDKAYSSFWSAFNTFEYLVGKTGMQFISLAGKAEDVSEDPGITNLGRMPRESFYKQLSQSVVMIGIGKPRLSPTPYDSLCLAVPFINPVDEWDKENPDDRSKWRTQHDALLDTSQPYVYHVFQHDVEGLTKALQAAKANPIGRHIPERMTRRAVRQRVKSLINLDWKALYKKRVVELRRADPTTLWLQ